LTVIGSGEYKYELIENWAKLPSGWSFGTVTGVAVDSQERLHVCQQQMSPPMLVFDNQGNYLSSWGTGTVVEPHTIYIGPDDILYLADRGAHLATKYSLDGQPLLEMGTRGQPSDTGCNEDEAEVLRAAGPFNRPTRLFPSSTGDLYVSDGYRNCRVHRFSAEGTLISSWGTPGKTAPGEIRSPHSVWIDENDLIYVCDRLNNRIQIFSATGEYVTQWSDLGWPTDIYMVGDTVYVCERTEEDSWITVRDKQGNVLSRFDTPRCHQIRVDSRGDIYMTCSSSSVGKCIRQR
jgi:hypothetical protein